MTSSPRRLIRCLLMALLLAPGATLPAAAQETDYSAHAAELKQLQIRFMMRTAQREVSERLARQRARRSRAGRKPEAGLTRRPAPAGEPADPPIPGGLGVASAAAPASATAIATNQIVNNRATDTATCPSAPCTGLPYSGQCEVSIGAFGNNLVAAWNDGEGFVTGLSTQGFGYSSNNGTTWTDGNIPPVTNVGKWTSDPVIAVNEKTGAFYYAALCEPSGTTNGIGVVKGTFSGGVLSWGTPQVVVSGTNTTVLFDKEWLTADSLTGNLYMIYSRFTVSGGVITTNRIDFTRNTSDLLLAWGAAVTLSAAGDAGRVQGSRITLGPAGEVWATWNAIGPAPVSLDFMRVRRLTNGGTTLGSEVTAASQYTNFGSGAPGFNRGLGFAFPSLAADRSTGPHRGRVYLCWNESVNFYNDNFAIAPVINESESNDTPATADPFTIGNALVGTLSSTTDLDYWSFSGVQGQTIICEMDSLYSTTLDASFRLFCTDGGTRLAFSETGTGGFNVASGLIVFTLPTTGTYYLRAASLAGTGTYRIRTVFNGAVVERGRDHRDVFTTFSDNGTTWSTPVRVNGEAANYDDWLPEVAVSGNGNVYVSWYDWRDSPPGICTGASMNYLSRSTDGGVSWPDGSPVSTTQSFWTTAYSNIAPNQGDYASLFANQNAVYSCWSDGRNSDPDVFMATVGLAYTAVEVSLASTYADPGLVRLTWYAAGGVSLRATVYRRTDDADWSALGEIFPDGDGRMAYEDRAVAAGTRYHYRLGVPDNGTETFTDEVTIDVPLEAARALAIQGVHPNPTDRQLWVSFSLPSSEPAKLELLDIAGRRVHQRTVTGIGQQTIDLAAGGQLSAGIYIVRLTQAGHTAVSRASVVR
jgi:type IX secretion system substrate protein